MIKFVTLYLGLVVGAHEVELMVDQGVAAVELRLDAETAARIDAPPWVASIDFGTALEPRELVAVAYDVHGVELDRTSQVINQPRPRVEAQVLIEHDAEGRTVAARVSWQSTEEVRPAQVLVTLDGKRLLHLEGQRYGLPPLDDDDFHLVQAEVRFQSGDQAYAQAAFGGANLAETGDALTALLVSLTGKKRSYDLEVLASWFLADGVPRPVVAAEKGPVELLFVRADTVASAANTLVGLPGGSGSNFTVMSMGNASEQRKGALKLGSDYRMRLLEPFATRVDRGHLSFESFIGSPDLRQAGGVLWALQQRFPLLTGFAQPRLADALAVAALQAARGNRRRAVVLVTAGQSPDFSTLTPEVAQAYLRKLQVPLFVWNLGAVPGPPGWPKATAIASYQELKHAVRSLEKTLGRQRVIWLDGAYDPESIQVAESADAALVGSPV